MSRPPAKSSALMTTSLRAILLVTLVVFLLRVTVFISMPLAIAAFTAILVWPMQRWLSQKLNPTFGTMLTALVVLAVIAGCFALVGWVISDFVSSMPTYRELAARVSRLMRRNLGISAPEPDLAGGALNAFGEVAARVGLGAITLTFVLLALAESKGWRRRVLAATSVRFDDASERLSAIARVFREYFALHSAVSALTGVSTALAAWALGVRDPHLWGLLAFLLNYVPNLGSIVAVALPTIVSALEHGAGRALVVAGVLGAVQAIIANWVAPRLQSRSFLISPLVALVSVFFWTWVWGIGGGLLAVPITVFLITLLESTPRWRWLAELLREDGARRTPPPEPRESSGVEPHLVSVSEPSSKSEPMEPTEPTLESRPEPRPSLAHHTASGSAL